MKRYEIDFKVQKAKRFKMGLGVHQDGDKQVGFLGVAECSWLCEMEVGINMMVRLEERLVNVSWIKYKCTSHSSMLKRMVAIK
jgi:hypothetical protein